MAFVLLGFWVVVKRSVAGKLSTEIGGRRDEFFDRERPKKASKAKHSEAGRRASEQK